MTSRKEGFDCFIFFYISFYFIEFITIQRNLDKHCQLEANYIQLNLIIQNSLIRGEAILLKETQVYWTENK